MKLPVQSKPKKLNGKKKTVKKNKKLTKNDSNTTETTKGGKDLSEMTVEDMFSMVQEDEELSDMEQQPKPETKTAKKKKKNKLKDKKEKVVKSTDVARGEDSEEDEEDEELTSATKMSQKEYLDKLKKSDPEFFATMMQSEDVMGIGSSGDEEEDADDEGDGGNEKEAEEDSGDSDASDAEEEGLQKQGSNMVTAAMVAKWENELKGDSPLTAFQEISQAFLAAIQSLGSNTGKEDTEVRSKYLVAGPQIFNAIIRVCLRCISQALQKILKLKNPGDDPTKCKRWGKLKNFFRLYLKNLISLISAVAEPTIAEAVLSRGVMPVINFYSGFDNISKTLLRTLVTLWSTNEKKVRVLAFLCIFRLTRSMPDNFLEWALKRMYMAYVQNSKFTSAKTWAMIDFMRMSLVEMYALNPRVTYKNAFLYIRQMAIHLRNAITKGTKDCVQTVYNWQFIHCIHLWADVFSKTHPNAVLQPLIFPLIQITLGTIRLQPSMVYCPLVFHLANILTDLSRHTNTFIPVMPILLEVLDRAPLAKKHKKASIRPLNWMCMLRLSKVEMEESGFKDGIVEQVYGGLVNYLGVESTSIAFPELVYPASLQLRNFLKQCKVVNFTKKIKQLLDKIKENSSFIESRRQNVTFNVADTQAVQNWEISTKQAVPPMYAFYLNWKKIQEKEARSKVATTIEMDDNSLPAIRADESNEVGEEELKRIMAEEEEDLDSDDESLDEEEEAEMERMFGSNSNSNKKKLGGSDEEVDDEEDQPPKKKKKEEKEEKKEKKKNKKKKKKAKETPAEQSVVTNDIDLSGDTDQVQVMNFSDFESDEDEKDDYGAESD